METTTLILFSLAILGFLCGFFFLYNIKLCQEQNSFKEYPKVSIIIPAKNEEHNIGTLLSSIKNQQFNVYEVIVVNDSSTDRTKEIALNFDVKVIDSKPLPEGWIGKPWACWQGANCSESEIFLFLDSDTFIEPGGLKRIIDSFLFENLSDTYKKGVVLSISPFHKVKKFYEDFSSIFNIIMVGSMNAFTPLKKNKPTGLFGQSLIVGRKNYFEIEGHSSVKNRILENVFMARKFRDKDIKLKCLGGKGTLSFRMYPDGFKALINGWTKAFAAGAGQTPFVTLLLIILWLSAGFITSIKIILDIAFLNSIILWLLLYLAFALQMYWILRKIGTFRFLTSLLFPVNFVFYVIVFFRSLYYLMFNKSIIWKSREVKA